MLEVPNPGCATLTHGAPSCEQTFDALERMGFVSEDAILGPASGGSGGGHGSAGPGAGLSRGFGCADVPWHLWNSLCEFDVLFVRRGLVGHWTQGVRIGRR